MSDDAGQLSFLLRLSDALRPLTDAATVEATACRMLGEHLKVNRVASADIDGDEFAVRQCWSCDRSPPMMRGSLAAFGRQALELNRRGEQVVVSDIENDGRFTADERARFIAADIRALIRLILTDGCKAVFAFGVHQCSQRNWTDAEIALVREVAQRIWTAADRARADTALRQSEARLQRMLQTDAVGILFLDSAGIVVGANDCFLKMSGHSRSDVELGLLHWRQMTPSEWLDENDQQLKLCATTGRLGPYEREYTKKDGSRGWLLITGSDLGDGTLAKFVINIDARKRAERALRASEEQLADELADMQVLQRISDQLVRDQNPQRWFEIIVDAAAVLMRSDAASVQQYDRERDKLELVAWRGFHTEAAASWEWISVQSGTTCGNALRIGGRVVVADIDTAVVEPETRECFNLCNLRSMQSTPLISHGGQVVGVLSTHWSRASDPSALSYRAFDVLARWAADLIVRVRIEEDLRDSEGRQKVLVAELQHRTRNIISVVQSLAERSAATAASLADFSTGFTNRLDAIARVQGLLSRSDNQPITIGALVQMELDAVGFPRTSDRIHLSGPEVRLRNAIVQTLALGLHELTTNALKHGSLGADAGSLDVSWTLHDHSGPHLLLEWRERGLQFSAEQRSFARRGHGIELIEQALPYTLGARTSFTLQETGAICTIDLPLDKFTMVSAAIPRASRPEASIGFSARE